MEVFDLMIRAPVPTAASVVQLLSVSKVAHLGR